MCVTQPPIVKVEALQALCALFETHAGKGILSLLDVIDLAKSAAKDSEGNIRLHAAKLFGCISKALSEMLAEQRSHSVRHLPRTHPPTHCHRIQK